ncbi:MAG: repeat-containing protein [Cyanobacteria bacterium RYN_339]|nr:repeat-containing protein [Cyanobacteria bacterium RYN_339]
MRQRALCLTLAVALAGCTLGKPTAPARTAKPVSTAASAPVVPVVPAAVLKPRIVPQVGEPTTLTGKVKIISDNGAGIISDNGGGIISDNGAGIISNNGSGLVSNNGGGLTSKVKRTLLAAPKELLLADAVLHLHDATGATLVDEAGKPLTATSDGQGGYTFKAVLPRESLVLRVPLRFGGELVAMVAQATPGARELPIDTGSSLGAAYVLGKYVKGDQHVFNKLPADEAQRLAAAADAARELLDKRPKYQPDDLVALVDGLRAKAPALDRKLEDIKVLLLGQANLGNGRPATSVPLTDIRGVLALPGGGFLVAERVSGRIRRVSADGLLTTYVDAVNGDIKVNLRRINELAGGPAGSVYFTSESNPRVVRLDPDGKQTVVAGNGTLGRGPLPPKAVDTPMVPLSVALAPDGTLYVGEARGGKTTDIGQLAPRVLAIAPNGDIRAIAVDPAWLPGDIIGLAVAADGTLVVLFRGDEPPGKLYRVRPGQAAELMAGDLGAKNDGDLALGKDGTVYVSERGREGVTAIAPDGKQQTIAGPTSATGPKDLLGAGTLEVGPDGTLYVADNATNRIWARSPAGSWAVVAGAGPSATTSADQVAVNVPGGAAFDPQGRLIFADGGSHAIRRFDFKTLETIVGSVEGKSGDGGPAALARLSQPTDLALRDGKLWIDDAGNHRIRMVDAAGTITTVVGGQGSFSRGVDGVPVPAASFTVKSSLGIALSPTGELAFTDVDNKSVFLLQADGLVHRIFGSPDAKPVDAAGGPAATMGPQLPGGMAFDTAGDLYVTDTIACQIYKITGPGTPEARVTVAAGVNSGTMLGRIADGACPNEDGHPALDATLVGPGGLTFDAAGNLYFTEFGTTGVAAFAPKSANKFIAVLADLPPLPGRVRKIAKDGTITTIAGVGGKFFNDPGADDPLGLPTGLAVSPDGRLAIVDSSANLIRFLPAGSY